MESVRPTGQYRESYLKLVDEFEKDSEKTAPFLIEIDNSDRDLYIQTMRDMEQGYNLRKGLVPCITYWMIDDSDEVVGSGGHIGYGVRKV